jgi:hypothetical protein
VSSTWKRALRASSVSSLCCSGGSSGSGCCSKKHLRFQALGFRVQGLKFRVKDSWLMFHGSGLGF